MRTLFRFAVVCAFAIGIPVAGDMTFPVDSFAATLYVGSLPGDYGTIQSAVNAASTGDTIWVRNGTYVENVTILTDGLTLRSVNGYNNTFIQAAGGDRALMVDDADNVTVEGFSFYGSSGDWTECVSLSYSDGCTLRNNRVGWDASHRNDTGIDVFWSNNCTITENICSWNWYSGIEIYNGYNNAVMKNTCNSNSQGIEVDGAGNNKVFRNHLEGNLDGILLEGESFGNTIAGNSLYVNNTGLSLDDSNGNIIYFNEFLSNTLNVLSLDSASNFWESGYPVLYHFGLYIPPYVWNRYMGNYYSTATTLDPDGDGISNNPHIEAGMQQPDPYPLAWPLGEYSGDIFVCSNQILISGSIMVFDSMTIMKDQITSSIGRLDIQGGTLQVGTLHPPGGSIL